MTSDVRAKEDKLDKLKEHQESKVKEHDMVLKKISLANQKIVEQLREDVVGLKNKVADSKIEFENVKKPSIFNDNISQKPSITQKVIDIQRQQKEDKDKHSSQMNKLQTEEQSLEIEIERYKIRHLESTRNNQDNDGLDSDEETNTARKVKPIQTPRNFVPVTSSLDKFSQ